MEKHYLRCMSTLFVCLFTALTLSAQQDDYEYPTLLHPDPTTIPAHVVGLEFGAASNGFGITYDHRIMNRTPLYLRTGVGYGFSNTELDFLGISAHENMYSVPVGVSYFFGLRRTKLEVGLGLTGTYSHASTKYVDNGTPKTETESAFSTMFWTNFAFRWQTRSGFMFRAGISPLWPLGNNSRVSNGFSVSDSGKMGVAVLLGVGWGF